MTDPRYPFASAAFAAGLTGPALDAFCAHVFRRSVVYSDLDRIAKHYAKGRYGNRKVLPMAVRWVPR